MKSFLVVLVLVAAVTAAPKYETIVQDYHEEVGIPQAARIKAMEESMDFDGSRIVGGTISGLGVFPHMGGLLITLTTGDTSVCGSSVLSNTRAVTAAHCWRNRNSLARQFLVVLGSVRLFAGGTRVVATRVELHANYNEINLNNDIAIITFPHVGFNNIVNRINLPAGAATYAGVIAVAAGFGRTADDASGGITTNQVLRHVNLPVITNANCQSVYGPSVVIGSILCTSSAGNRNVCGGDSGGPLQIAGPTLIGVANFVASQGCQSGLPAGFARVTSFVAWLRARM